MFFWISKIQSSITCVICIPVIKTEFYRFFYRTVQNQCRQSCVWFYVHWYWKNKENIFFFESPAKIIFYKPTFTSFYEKSMKKDSKNLANRYLYFYSSLVLSHVSFTIYTKLIVVYYFISVIYLPLYNIHIHIHIYTSLFSHLSTSVSITIYYFISI